MRSLRWRFYCLLSFRHVFLKLVPSTMTQNSLFSIGILILLCYEIHDVTSARYVPKWKKQVTNSDCGGTMILMRKSSKIFHWIEYFRHAKFQPNRMSSPIIRAMIMVMWNACQVRMVYFNNKCNRFCSCWFDPRLGSRYLNLFQFFLKAPSLRIHHATFWFDELLKPIDHFSKASRTN